VPPTPELVPFSLTVVNLDGIGLEGGEYALYESGSTEIYKTAVSDVYGLIDFGEIPLGEYTLQELLPPPGYDPNTQIYPITATENGVLLEGREPPHTIFNYPIGTCPDDENYANGPLLRADNELHNSHNTPIKSPVTIFDNLATNPGKRYDIVGYCNLPSDMDYTGIASTHQHIQGIGRTNSGQWIISHNPKDKNRKNGYFVVTRVHTESASYYDASYSGTQNSNLKYNHPGGFQIIGDYMAVGLETADWKNSIVALYDIKNLKSECSKPESGPVFRKVLVERGATSSPAVGITDFKLKYPDGAIQNYFIMAVTSPDRIDLYLGAGDDLGDADFFLWKTIKSGDRDFKIHDYQGISLITLANESGAVESFANIHIIAPFTLDVLGIPTKDRCDYWRFTVEIKNNGVNIPDDMILELKRDVPFDTDAGGLRGPHFRWGCGVYLRNENSFELLATDRNFVENNGKFSVYYVSFNP
jgi:hypothetical protein